jgi:hypothetical protein
MKTEESSDSKAIASLEVGVANERVVADAARKDTGSREATESQAIGSSFDSLDERIISLEEAQKGSTTIAKRIQSWLTLAFALLGTILGLIGFIEGRRSADISRSLEVKQYLDEAWDRLGGKPGTTEVYEYTGEKSDIEIARRLIDKALLINPKNASALNKKGAYSKGLSGDGEPVEETGYLSFMVKGGGRDMFFCEAYPDGQYKIKAAYDGKYPFRDVASGKFE